MSALRKPLSITFIMITCLMILACLMFEGGYGAQAVDIPEEYKVKAAYIYQFVKYVEWPDQGSQVKILVLNGSPMYPALTPVQGKKVGEREVLIQHIDSLEGLEPCHILFVSSDAKEDLMTLSKNLSGTLVVGEREDFILKGGMVRFYLEGRSVRFEINPKAAENAGIKISSKLLRLGAKS